MVLDSLRELSFSLMNHMVEYQKKLLLDLCKIVFLLISSTINDLRFEKCKFILRKLDRLENEVKKKLSTINSTLIQAKDLTEIELEVSQNFSTLNKLLEAENLPITENREFYK